MILLEFSLAPLGKQESVSEYVAQSLAIVQESGLDYRLHAMGTILEGEWDEVMGVVKKCFDALVPHASRITCTMKLDYRAGATGRLDAKVQSVQDKLKKPLKIVEPPND